MFDFFSLEMSDGVSESGYITAFNRKRRMLCGSSAKECPKKVWIQAVEDFEHALSVDEVEAFTCNKCPSEDSEGDGQDEVHIGDGVCEGTQVELVPEHVKDFKEPLPDNSVLVEGLELFERTIFVQPKFRKVLFSLLEGNKKSNTSGMPCKPKKIHIESVKVAAKKCKNLLMEENEGETKIYEFLEYLSKSLGETVPDCYINLLYEIARNTPISGIFQSSSRTFQAALKSFLDENLDIFDDKELLDHLYEEIPVVMKILASIRAYEGSIFLPEAIKNLLEAMLQLFSKMNKLASERFVKSDTYSGLEPPNEYFPSLPLHSARMNFKADHAKNRSERADDYDCNKDYPKAPKMTPGLAHIFCQHKVCKGFVSMTSAENPEIFTKILTRRLPKLVKASRRVFLYDNSCNLHKNALKRDAKDKIQNIY